MLAPGLSPSNGRLGMLRGRLSARPRLLVRSLIVDVPPWLLLLLPPVLLLLLILPLLLCLRVLVELVVLALLTLLATLRRAGSACECREADSAVDLQGVADRRDNLLPLSLLSLLLLHSVFIA